MTGRNNSSSGLKSMPSTPGFLEDGFEVRGEQRERGEGRKGKGG
jgi:hypothetical protein